MPRYRKRPVEVTAWQLIDVELSNIPRHVVDAANLIAYYNYFDGTYFSVKTLEGVMKGKLYDYLIQGIAGEYYICDHQIFLDSYEEIS